MKKPIALLLSILMLFACAACGQQPEEKTMGPKDSQIKAICELAVMDCYCHNVAKYRKENASGSLWWKKDKHFWIEYSGSVKLGIDASLVNVKVDGTQVTVTIPEAKVLSCKVDSSTLTEDSFIVDKNSAKIEAADEVEAFGEAQADRALLASAQQRAQQLLEEYITNIGNVVGTQYSIQWVYVDANGNPLGTAASEPAAPPEAEEPAA